MGSDCNRVIIGGAGPLWGQNGLLWEHSVEAKGGGEVKTESLIMWLVVLELGADGWL